MFPPFLECFHRNCSGFQLPVYLPQYTRRYWELLRQCIHILNCLRLNFHLIQKNKIIARRNKKLLFFSSSFFFIFLRKIMCSLIFFQWYHICRNCESNFVMVNKNKKIKSVTRSSGQTFILSIKQFVYFVIRIN